MKNYNGRKNTICITAFIVLVILFLVCVVKVSQRSSDVPDFADMMTGWLDSDGNEVDLSSLSQFSDLDPGESLTVHKEVMIQAKNNMTLVLFADNLDIQVSVDGEVVQNFNTVDWQLDKDEIAKNKVELHDITAENPLQTEQTNIDETNIDETNTDETNTGETNTDQTNTDETNIGQTGASADANDLQDKDGKVELDENRFMGGMNGWYYVNLPSDKDKITLSLNITSIYGGESGYINEIYMGNITYLIGEIISSKGPQLFLYLILLLSGIIQAVMFFASPMRKKIDTKMLSLAAYNTLIALYGLATSSIFYLLVSVNSIAYYLRIFSFMGIPVVLMLAIGFVFDGWSKIVGRIMLCVNTIVYIVFTVLDISRRVAYYETKVSMRILFMLSCLIFALSIIYKIYKEKKIRENAWSLFGIGVMIIGHAIIVWNWMNFDSDKASHYIVWVFAFCVVILSIVEYKKTLNIMMLGEKAQEIHQNAVTDILSGVGNRMALEENTKKWSRAHKLGKEVGVVQFDVNNLKRVNDELGHEQGDEMIMEAARMIAFCFSSFGECFRTGGDEFVVIGDGKDLDQKYKECEEILCEKMKTRNEDMDCLFKVEIAYGYAKIEAEENYDLAAMIRIADERMYECKRKMKGAENVR